MRVSRQRELSVQRSCGRRQTVEPKEGYSLAGAQRTQRRVYRQETGETGQAKLYSFVDWFKDLGFYPKCNSKPLKGNKIGDSKIGAAF